LGAVDETRRIEQQEKLGLLSGSYLKTAKAYQLKVAFQEFWESSVRVAPLHMKIWYGWAMRSKIQDMMKAAKTIRQNARREDIGQVET